MSGVQLMNLGGREAGMPSFWRFSKTVPIHMPSFLERAASEIVPSMAIFLRVQLCRFPSFDGWGFMGRVAESVITNSNRIIAGLASSELGDLLFKTGESCLAVDTSIAFRRDVRSCGRGIGDGWAVRGGG